MYGLHGMVAKTFFKSETRFSQNGKWGRRSQRHNPTAVLELRNEADRRSVVRRDAVEAVAAAAEAERLLLG